MILVLYENFGGGSFCQIITDEAIGEENFGESADHLQCIYKYWSGKI